MQIAASPAKVVAVKTNCAIAADVISDCRASDDSGLSSVACMPVTSRSSAHATVVDVDPDVSDVDEDDEDDDDSSDKENATSSVFPFHQTPSVAAMERIFAQQRQPNFVRPKGYISPLQCPRYTSHTTHVCRFHLCKI